MKRKIKYTDEERAIIEAEYSENDSKVETIPENTKYLLVTHPIVFITTIGRVNGKLKTDIAPFATCLDTSYFPPYVTFSCSIKQHSIQGQKKSKGLMNTYSNIRQNGLFVVNVPDRDLIKILDIVAYPYGRNELEDKIKKAKLTKIKPFVLLDRHKVYPPLIGRCLAHLECEVIDIHKPVRGDHYNVTGKVVSASYKKSLGDDIEQIRKRLVKRVFHHFGACSIDSSVRYIGFIRPSIVRNAITFHAERKIGEQNDR